MTTDNLIRSSNRNNADIPDSVNHQKKVNHSTDIRTVNKQCYNTSFNRDKNSKTKSKVIFGF